MARNKLKIIIPILLIAVISIGVYMYLNKSTRTNSETEVIEYNYFLLNQNDKYGVIDTFGNIVINPSYDAVIIPNPEKPIFVCKSENKNIILNEQNQEVFTEYEEVDAIVINGIVSSLPYEKNVLVYKQDGKYGLINYEGKKITKPIYEEITGLANKESELLVKKDNKYGVINEKGVQKVKAEYDNIVADGYYSEANKYDLSGYIVSNKTTDGYRYGYINYKGKKILEVQYNSIDRILTVDDNNVYLVVAQNGQHGVMKNDKIHIERSYQGIAFDDNSKLFELQRNEKYGIADINGKEIIPVKYEEIQIKGIYIQAFENEEDTGVYFDMLGNEVKEIKYAAVLKTSNNEYFITISSEGFYGIINSENEELITNTYNYIEYLFGDYFIASNENGYLGIIDKSGNIIVDFKYEVLQKIEDTKLVEAKILKENKLEIYSEKIEKVYSSKNAKLYKNDKYISVYAKGETKYFDYLGNELKVTEVFKENSLISANQDNKWGFVDKNGATKVDYKYDEVTEFNSYGFAGIKQDNKWGVIDENCNIIVEPKYEISETNQTPEFLGKYYKVYYGYGESYYTDKISE